MMNSNPKINSLYFNRRICRMSRKTYLLNCTGILGRHCQLSYTPYNSTGAPIAADSFTARQIATAFKPASPLARGLPLVWMQVIKLSISARKAAPNTGLRPRG